jgi:hypothetical protein
MTSVGDYDLEHLLLLPGADKTVSAEGTACVAIGIVTANCD